MSEKTFSEREIKPDQKKNILSTFTIMLLFKINFC